MNLVNLDPKKREQYLMILCGVMLVVAVIPIGFYLFGTEVTRMQKKIESTRKEIQELETKRTAGFNFDKRIKQAAVAALPINNELAVAEYKNWLTTLVSDLRFEGVQVSNTGTTPVKAKVPRGQTGLQGPDTYYTNYKFSVSGKTTLTNLGRFLQQFYEVKTQHLIRNMTIKPSDAQRVDVTMVVEAISIPQTLNTNYVPQKKDDDSTPWQQMIATVVDRNIFGVYVAPPPLGSNQPVPPPTVVSAAKHTYLNGVTWSNNRGQAWFNFRLEGRQAILKVGDRFRIGETNCTIEAINKDRTIEILATTRDRETGEMIREIYLLMVGDTFADAAFVRDFNDDEGAT